MLMLPFVRKAVLVCGLAAAGSIVAACGSKRAEAPPRSPTFDYPPPAQETSQGEVLGADRMPPGDKLKTGPTIGPGGVTPAAGPGTSEPQQTPAKNKKPK